MNTNQTLQRISVSAALFAMSLSILPVAAYAGPQDGVFEVDNGGAIAETTPGTWDITAPDGSVINYTSFNVGETEIVNFIQGSADARVLNRINSGLPTNLDGQINADGQVYWLNRSGILIGPSAVINTAAFYAAAADMTSEDFAAKIDQFVDAGGSVENRGEIRAALVHLIGRQVANFGSIETPGGNGDVIALSAGDDILISSPGSGVVVMFSGTGTDPGSAGVTNEGTLDAGAGQVSLGAGDMYALAVSHPGTSMGGSVTVKGSGDVVIGGDLNGAVNIEARNIDLGNGGINSGGAVASLTAATGQIRSLEANDGTAEIVTGGGALTMSAGAGGIGDAASDQALEVDLGAGALSLVTTGAAVIASQGGVDLDQSVVAGDLDLTANGAISDSGAVSVVGNASFTTTGVASSIVLDDSGTSVGGSAVLKASGDVVIAAELNGAVDIEAVNIDLGNGAITTGGAAANLTAATGQIRSLDANDGTAEIVTGGGALTMSAGAGGIGDAASGEALEVDLDAGALSVVTTGSALLASQGATNLGQSVVGGDLMLTATGGGITDSGAVTVVGGANFTTTGTGAAANPILLDELGSSFGSVDVNTLDGNGAAGNGDVTIRQNADIQLGDAVTTGNLSLNAGPDGDITLTGPIGRAELLESLTLVGDLISVGEVGTLGGQSYTGNGITLNGNLETVRGGNIVFDGAVSVPMSVAIATGGGFGDFNEAQVRFLSTLDGPGALLINVRDNSQLFFGGNLGSTTPLGDLNFVSAGVRSGVRRPGIVFAGTEVNALSISLNEPTAIAAGSLFSADTDVRRPTIVGTGPSLTFDVQQRFGMGVPERMVVTDGIDSGLLRIDAAEAAISDLAALQIEIVAPLIALQLRAAGFVELSPGASPSLAAGQTLAQDRGLDIVANTIFLSSTPTLVGTGPEPFLVVANAAGISGPVQGLRRRLFSNDEPGPITAADLSIAGAYYDTTGFGPEIAADGSLLALSAQFGENWTKPPTAFQAVPGPIGGGQRQQLQANRQLWGDEVLAFLNSARSFSGGQNLFGSWAAGAQLGLIGAEGSDLELVASALGLPAVSAGGGRTSQAAFQLTKPAARSALQLFEALQSDAPQIVAKLELAMELHKDDPTSDGLAATLRSDPNYRDVAAYLGGYAQLLEGLQDLYLSENEYAGLKTELLRDAAPAGLPVESLVRAFAEPRS